MTNELVLYELETNLINLFNDETLQSELIKRWNQFVENFYVNRGNSSNTQLDFVMKL